MKTHIHTSCREVFRAHCRAFVVVVLSVGSMEVQSGNPPTTAPYGPYQNLYLSRFAKLSLPDPSAISQVGICRVYPRELAALWQSCLDVIGQYDAVARLSRESRVAVFAHGLNALKEVKKNEKVTRYYDALLVVSLQPRGSHSTAVYVAWLPPRKLLPAAVPTVPPKTDPGDFGKATDEESRRWAAAIVAARFFSQLSVQALYQDRWKQKFGF